MLALSTALAYISGYYKQTLMSRSLLTGSERLVTIELRSLGSSWPNPLNVAFTILRKYWPTRLADSVKGMKARND